VFDCRNSATTPATCGAAIEVPEMVFVALSAGLQTAVAVGMSKAARCFVRLTTGNAGRCVPLPTFEVMII